MTIVSVIALSNLVGWRELQYRNFKLIDQHITEAYQTIFDPPRLAEMAGPSFLGEPYQRCVIYTQPDSLIYSVLYYNQFIAPKKCFVFSIASFAGHFRAITS